MRRPGAISKSGRWRSSPARWTVCVWRFGSIGVSKSGSDGARGIIVPRSSSASRRYLPRGLAGLETRSGCAELRLPEAGADRRSRRSAASAHRRHGSADQRPSFAAPGSCKPGSARTHRMLRPGRRSPAYARRRWGTAARVAGPLRGRIERHEHPGRNEPLESRLAEMGDRQPALRGEPGLLQPPAHRPRMKVEVEGEFDRRRIEWIPCLAAQQPAGDCLNVALVGILKDQGGRRAQNTSQALQRRLAGRPYDAAPGSSLPHRRHLGRTADDRHPPPRTSSARFPPGAGGPAPASSASSRPGLPGGNLHSEACSVRPPPRLREAVRLRREATANRAMASTRSS